MAAADLEDVFLSSLVMNLSSAFVFSIGRYSRAAVQCYDTVKFAWCLQLVLIFTGWDGLNSWVQMVVIYGFFFDFFLLLNRAAVPDSITISHIGFRFMTNLIHHMTIPAVKARSATPVEIAACTIAWATHLFPWLFAIKKKSWYRNICIVGNFAHMTTAIHLHFTGELYSKSLGELGILAFMIVYRMLYINCKFEVFSRNEILSTELEDRLLDVFWYWTLAVATLVSYYFGWCLLGADASIRRLQWILFRIHVRGYT